MRHISFILLLSMCFLLTNCKDESEDVKPIIAETLGKDSIPSSSTAITDSTAVQDSLPAAKQSNPNNSTLDFTDSAYYQRAAYGTMPYRVMTPSKYDDGKNYPLVIFLHGIDERGTDNEKQLKWGASLFRSDSVRTKHPSFVIFPQCSPNYYWVSPESMNQLKGLIDDFVAHHNVDTKRIYLVGLSMGAYGTYEMVARNPALFAAAIAISGDGDLGRASNMAKTEWKIYAGKKDHIVTSDKSERMAKALADHGAKVSLKVYENANHVGSWVNAFEEPDFCTWLFSVTK